MEAGRFPIVAYMMTFYEEIVSWEWGASADR